MDQDIRSRRAGFIGDSTDVREMFSFAHPNQIIQAVKTYCCSMHNCMTWPLFSDMAKQFYNCWSTCIKLVWDLDRSTKTYFVDNLLAGGLPSMRSSVLACYGKFYQSVRHSPALEIRAIACIASTYVRSTTGANLMNLTREYGNPVSKVRQNILDERCLVPDMDRWRMKYLGERHTMKVKNEDSTELDALILSLVTT